MWLRYNMSSTIEERTAYLNNPFFTKHPYGDFSPFYITIGICTVLGFFIFALNIFIGCCSKHKHYWQDRHTGNRWLVSIWSATPHRQPPLDLTELEDVTTFAPPPANTEYDSREYAAVAYKQKQQQLSQGGYEGRGFGPGHHHNPDEYVELQQKRIESDI